jgi:hypothetical protein
VISKAVEETREFIQKLDQIQKRQWENKKNNLEKGQKVPERKQLD